MKGKGKKPTPPIREKFNASNLREISNKEKKFLNEYSFEEKKPSDLSEDQKKSHKWFEDQENWGTWWPLHRAAMYGEISEIRKLIENEGFDPNEKMTDWVESEPLGWAASFGNLGAVIELIKLGADPFRPPNAAGYTPITDAERDGRLDVIEFFRKYENLRKRGDEEKDFDENNIPRNLEELLNEDIGSPSDTREDQKKAYEWFNTEHGGKWVSEYPLHRAAMYGDSIKIRDLIQKKGFDPNHKMTDWFDSEPLGWAASFGNLQAVIELIKLGADPLRPANTAGNTPLKDAQRENYRRVIKFLKKYELIKKLEKNE